MLEWCRCRDFNEGQSGRTDVVEGMLEESGSTIPVVGVSFATGEVDSMKIEVLKFVLLSMRK